MSVLPGETSWLRASQFTFAGEGLLSSRADTLYTCKRRGVLILDPSGVIVVGGSTYDGTPQADDLALLGLAP